MEGGVTRLSPQSLERAAAAQKRGHAGTLKAEEKQTEQDLRWPHPPRTRSGGSEQLLSLPVTAAMPGGVWALALALMLLHRGNGRQGRALAEGSAGRHLDLWGGGFPGGTWELLCTLKAVSVFVSRRLPLCPSTYCLWACRALVFFIIFGRWLSPLLL